MGRSFGPSLLIFCWNRRCSHPPPVAPACPNLTQGSQTARVPSSSQPLPMREDRPLDRNGQSLYDCALFPIYKIILVI